LKKPDLADLVQQHFEANRRQALDFVDIFFDTITNAVAAGDKVSIAGFGIWEKKNRPARMARNPMTGAPVKVPAKTVAKFRAAADFKAIVLGGKRAAKKAKKVTAKKTKKVAKKVTKKATKGKSILGLKKKAKKKR
jgi:DNA-binding protein HU-beta